VSSGNNVVDLAFRLKGDTVAADHGYALYSTLSRVLPQLHGESEIGIHPIRGRLIGSRQLALTSDSSLVLRLPAEHIPEAIRIAGKRLDLNGNHLRVGVPTVHALLPAPSVVSRLVTIKGSTEAEAFLSAAQRQLVALGIDASASLIPHRMAMSIEAQVGSQDAVVRRTVRIRDREIVGFAVRVDGLSADESVSLQATGIGGRRRFGCGLFNPISGQE
jgi:CRISPR-associated protein Cas6